MTSPWPLFSDDLGIARDWIEQAWNQGDSPLRVGHQALSLGLKEMVLERMHALHDEPHAEVCQRQWGFRFARMRGDHNPYNVLIGESLKQSVAKALEDSVLHNKKFFVWLNGGVGDQLETVSLLLPWSRKYSIHLCLLVESSRRPLIQEIVPAGVQVIDLDLNRIPLVSQGMAVRQAVLARYPDSSFHSFLADGCRGWVEKSGLLCCWKAEGRGNAFSAHSRSVPFLLVRKFYETVLNKFPQISIVDITDWQDWEAASLAGMKVDLVDPCKGQLLDLAREAYGRRVITIDTALAHLCAACGISANVLLPQFHDERWFELHRPSNSYGRCLKVWRSPDFGSWNSVMQKLCESF